MPLNKLNLTYQGTNTIPVKGVAPQQPMPLAKPFALDQSGALQPLVKPIEPTQPNNRIAEIQSIVGAQPNNRIAEIQAIMSGAQPEQEPKRGLLGKIWDIASSTPGRFLASGAAALGATGRALTGDLEGANKRLDEGYTFLGKQYKPYKIGVDIDEQKERGMFGKETLETIGAGAELASYFMGGSGAKAGYQGAKALAQGLAKPTLGRAIKQTAFREGAAGVVGGLGMGAQEEDATIGSIAGAGLLGGVMGMALGAAIPSAGALFQKARRIADPTVETMVKKYDSALGQLVNVKDIDNNLQNRARAMGLQPMSTGELLLREGVPLKAEEEGGRLVYKTMQQTETLKPRLKTIADEKDKLLAIKKDKQFDLDAVKEQAIANLDKKLLQDDKNRIAKLIERVFDAEKEVSGRFVDGETLDRVKSGLQSRGNYKKQALEGALDTGNAQGFRKAATVAREAIEEGYSDIADIKKIKYLESQSRNAMGVLDYLDGRVVSGGKLSKDLAGVVGSVIGASSKMPIIGPIIGKETAEALRNRAINPQRITEKLVKKMSKKGLESPLQTTMGKLQGGLNKFQRAQQASDEVLKKPLNTKLLESAQMKAQRALNEGGEISVSPTGEAKVTKATRTPVDTALMAERETPRLLPPKTSGQLMPDNSALITMPDYNLTASLSPQEVNEMLRAGLLKREGSKLIGGENAFGLVGGIEVDENGKPTGKFNLEGALAGMAGMTAVKKLAPKLAGKGDDVLFKEVKKYKTAEEFVRAQETPDLSTLKKQAENLKQRFHVTQSGNDLRAWRKTQNDIEKIESNIIKKADIEKARLQRQADEKLRQMDSTIDKLSKEDLDFLVNEARKTDDLDDFIGRVRGSASQYGEYNPKLRKYLRPESVFVGDIKGLNPNTRVTVYRGIDLKSIAGKKIKTGDFVTTDYDEALQYTDSPSKVVSKKVRLKDLIEEYPDEIDISDPLNPVSYELIYNPTGKINKITESQLTDIWNKANKKTR